MISGGQNIPWTYSVPDVMLMSAVEVQFVCALGRSMHIVWTTIAWNYCNTRNQPPKKGKTTKRYGWRKKNIDPGYDLAYTYLDPMYVTQ